MALNDQTLKHFNSPPKQKEKEKKMVIEYLQYARKTLWQAYALTHCHSPALTHVLNHKSKQYRWDFPDGPVVKNLASSAADTGSIPKIAYATREARSTTTEPAHSRAHAPHLGEPEHCNKDPVQPNSINKK